MLARQMGEVDDELIALGLRDKQRGDWHWPLQKAALRRDHYQRIACAQLETILPGVGAIEHAEAVAARLDAQEGLLRSVDHDGVAKDTVVTVKGIEDRKEQRAIGLEAPILQAWGDINLAGGQAQPRLACIVDQIESRQATIDIFACDIDVMIVIPLGAS